MQIDERTAQGLWLDHLELDALIEDIERSALDPETTQYIMESAVRNADRKAMRRVAAWLLEDSNANQD